MTANTFTIEDFRSSGWRDVLANATRDGYPSMHLAFSSAAQQAKSQNRDTHAEILDLLGAACSMMLAPESVNEPFKPWMVLRGQRTPVPDDLSEDAIAFLAAIVEEIDDPWLKARLADLVWLKQSKRDVSFALAAIDAYRMISLDVESWLRGGKECWTRAIQLSRMLRGGAGPRLSEIEASLCDAFAQATTDDGFFCVWIAQLLREERLGRSHAASMGDQLRRFGEAFERDRSFHQAREYFSEAASFFRAADDESAVFSMIVRQAESWVDEAAARVSSDQQSYMVAATFYEHAIQTYRSIPRAVRSQYRVDERLAELHTLLRTASARALDELKGVSTPSVDISQSVERAREAVRGKSTVDALRVLCSFHRGIDVKGARERAIELLRQFPLQSLFSTIVMGGDGRVVAKRPGLSLGDETSDEAEAAIWAQMLREHQISVGLVVQGHIVPALEVMWLEHRLPEAEFIGLASQSPIVPKDRVVLFGKALFAGYDRDFATALHLLVPQLEHMVRHHLKNRGVRTTTLDSNGIENEVGLSSLMELSETEEIFGENLRFELRALFCDSLGPNLRNEVAHGLLNDQASQSIAAIYAWWLGLKLVFVPFWNSLPVEESAHAEGAQ